ncbi:MAG: hypothetical protein KW804_02930 [Candidatus Doudnabacteria bacterium]|nr:hypothetical protein [Candidatus Doudnabacteria bacterium]
MTILSDAFPDPKPTPPPPSPKPTPAPEINEGLKKIRSLKTKPGSSVEWVSQNMIYPCNPTAESKRLKSLLPPGQEISVGTLYQSILLVLKRAGLWTGPPQSKPTAVAELATPSQLTTSLEEIITHVATFQSSLSDKLRSLQLQVQRVDAETGRLAQLNADNAALRSELAASREEAKKAKAELIQLREKLRQL